MINFYYRAGSAATDEALQNGIRACLDKGDKVLLLVPEQETVSTERHMLTLLPPAAQLSFEVVNFSRLAERTFRQLGGLSYHTATPGIKALLMWKTLRTLKPELQQLAPHAEGTHLSSMMLETAAQCKAYGISPEELRDVTNHLADDPTLRDKLSDLATAISGYDILLGERFDDSDNDLSRLTRLIQSHGKALFGDTHIFVDSFTDFTGQEISVLQYLMANAASFHVTFPLSSAGTKDLHLVSALDTHRRLLRMAHECNATVTRNAPPESVLTAKDYLAEHLFSMTAKPAPAEMVAASDVTLTVCDSPFAEAEAAVAEIHRLVRQGYRYRDITVVLRDAQKSCGIIDAALEKEGIPFFLSEKTDVTVRPLIKLILLSLRIHLYGWRDEDVIGYLKTGLTGISEDDVNLFEEYARVWHPRGKAAYTAEFTRNPDGYVTEKSDRALRILEGANRTREALLPPLFKFFDALDAANGATALCRAIYGLLLSLQVGEKLKEQALRSLSAGERREAEELSRLFTVTQEALESVSLALGDEPLTLSELTDALTLVFGRTDIGTIPTSADEVTVGSASMLRADHPKFVLVLGLNEGEFPRSVTNSGLINDQEKERLAALGLVLPSGRAKRTSDELFFVWRAFAAPTEGLYLSYSKCGTDGRPTPPSIAISRTLALLKDLPQRHYEDDDPLSHIYTPNGALDRLALLGTAEREAVLSLLIERGVNSASAALLPIAAKEATVSDATAKSLFEKKEISPSQLESFAACRFAYYCSRILRLREEKHDTVGAATIGLFIHYVLEKVMVAVKKEGGRFDAWSEKDTEALVREVCEEYKRDLAENGSPITPRGQALLARLSTLAHLIVDSLFAEFKDSLFSPAFLELDVNGALGTAFETGSKNKIPFRGKADRVDVWQAPDGTSYLRVADYKTGTRKFSTDEIRRGFCMQMPLYLWGLCSKPHPTLNKALGLPADNVFRPAGVSYLSSAISGENTPARIPEDVAMQHAAKRLMREGVVLDDEAVRNAMSLSGDESICGGKGGTKALSDDEMTAMFHDLENSICRITSEMRHGLAYAHPHQSGNRIPCEYCAFRAVCRSAKL